MPHPLIDSIAPQASLFSRLRQALQTASGSDELEEGPGEVVVEHLQQWGYTVVRHAGGAGVVGQLRRGDGLKRLGLLTDMARRPGAAGARAAQIRQDVCGGHAAMLLGAAHYLARQGDFSGTLNLIFQPTGDGDRDDSRLAREAVFARNPCDAVYAMRSAPGRPPGRLLLCDGPAMASHDMVTVTLESVHRDGSASQGTTDPVVAGAAIVLGLQSIATRNAEPLQMAAITVDAFETGHADGLFPPTAILRLGVRALDGTVREMLLRRITELADWQSRSYGVRAALAYRRCAPLLVNSPNETELARQVALELLGPGMVQTQSRAMAGGEPLACMLENVPGSYLQIGSGAGRLDKAAGSDAGPAAARGLDDQSLVIGASYWAMLAQCYLI
ncbi:MAG TPA: M20/M25/M40 family metallo-hydrolase [Pseudorhodoferax sp.]|nr:M20/M25/M40 family metallo-hydrolase [Pseudorhodoferax sp.]